MAKLAALISPPRQHRVRYYASLAPRAGLRQPEIATAGPGDAPALQLRGAPRFAEQMSRLRLKRESFEADVGTG